MSLKLRLNLLINLLFLLFMVGACVYIIKSAQHAVAEEVRSVSNLTSRLLAVIVSSSHPAGQHDRLISELQKLQATRHLQVAVSHSSLERRSPPHLFPDIRADAPAWFIALIKPPRIEFRRLIANKEASLTEIIVFADPADEITEVWHDMRNFLLLLLLFTVLANGIIFFVLGRDLAPVTSILAGLERIEKGDYTLRLPPFSTPEFSAISEKFNVMTAVLSASRKENQYLTRRTLEIQEQERRALAHELHDELGQTISAIKAVAASIEASDDVSSVQGRAAIIKQHSDAMYAVASRLIRQLRPTVLDELGLQLALQEMVDNWNAAHADTFCYLEIHGDYSRLDELVKINIYRIIQESLTNVSRHAEAKDVHVSLIVQQNQALRITIDDDGRGFDAGNVEKGLGLTGMRERMDYMGGEMQIETAPGEGVKITLQIPMQGRAVS